jgi:hypothetical protein
MMSDAAGWQHSGPTSATVKDNDMTELTRNDLDSHDWAARAAEDLAQAKKLPPGFKRSEAIRKAEQLRFAADMQNWLKPKESGGVPKVTG